MQKMQKNVSNTSNMIVSNTGDLQLTIQSTSNKEPELGRKIEALDTLYKSLTKLSKCRTHKELFIKLPKILSNLISFDKMSIIVISNKLAGIFEAKDVKGEGVIKIRDMFYNGIWIKVLNIGNFPFSNPQFNSLGQILIGKKR